MALELDELLEDLQSALPAEVTNPTPRASVASSSTHSGHVNGHSSPPYDTVQGSHYDSIENPQGMIGYEMPVPESPTRASVGSSISQAIVVRYVGEESQPSPTQSSAPFDDVMYSEVRKGPHYVPKEVPRSPPAQTTSPPPSKPPRSSMGGLSELDNLLAMLSDTERTIQQNADAQPPPRPSVADFMDELSEVEQRVKGPTSPKTDKETARVNITASRATKELDDLMLNLSNFEVAPSSAADPQPEQERDYSKLSKGGGKSAVADLNSMLGSLNQEMEMRHGVDTASKGDCAACNKPILAKVVNALGRQWHPEHFTCASCDAELGATTYYESNGRPYCEKDYHEMFAPRCAFCNGPILERVMRALEKTWHPEHFFCTLCGKHFGPEGFHEKEGKAYCRECYYEKFAPRCKRCEKAIMEGFVTALNAQWHPECFSCKVCGVTFPRGNYYEHEGEPHCELHYHASRGTLCASCQKPVTGKCITAMGKKWHPEHFTCAFCLKLLNKGTFKEHRHNPYCQPCYIKLFG